MFSFSLREIKFLVGGVYVNISVGFLSEVDLRPGNLDFLGAGFDGHIRHQEARHSFRCELIRCIYRQPVAVRIDQFLVNPVTRRPPEVYRRQSRAPRASPAASARQSDSDLHQHQQNHKSSNRLNLLECVLQGTPIPEPDVFEGRPVGVEVQRFDRVLRFKLPQFNLFQPERPARPVNVVLDVRGLACQVRWA